MNGDGGGLCFSARPRDEWRQGCLVQTLPLPLTQLSLTGSDRCNAGHVAEEKGFEARPYIQSRPLGFSV